MFINNKQFVVVMDDKNYHCAMDITMDYIGGKWKAIILWYLHSEKKRFSELNRLIPQITEKMLSIQLKQLEESGLVERKVFMEMPMRVEYSLTDFGKTLSPALEEMALWGRELGKARGKVVEYLPEKEPDSKTPDTKSVIG
jgi:DNA-binding HxlR family transcriptional regulator